MSNKHINGTFDDKSTSSSSNILQDLQRLIKAADQLTEAGSSNKKKKTSATKKKEEETRSWRIQDKPLNAGVSLRSAKTKQALQVCLSNSYTVDLVPVILGAGVVSLFR